MEIVKDWIQRADAAPNKRLFDGIGLAIIERTFHNFAALAGLPSSSVHDLRHSHASMLIEVGCSPLLVQELLVHGDVQTTLRTYSHLYPDKQKGLAELLQQA